MAFKLPSPIVSLLLAAAIALSGCGDDKATALEHLQRASEHLTRDDTRAATIELKSALQLDPDNVDARLSLGRIHLAQGDGPSARKELERARELGARDEALDRDVTRSRILVGAYQEALDGIPRDGADSAPWKLLEGNALAGLGKIDAAREAFERAIALDPDATEARRGLARLDLARGDGSAAQDQVREALARNDTDVQTWLLKGELELSLEDPAAAEASFAKVLEFAPDLPAGRIGLARALLAQQKSDAAGEQLRALERLNIDDPLLNYLQAVEARQKNDLKTAQDALREVLRKAPGHAPSQLLMGQIHLLRRELDQAKSMLSSYVAQAPGNTTGRKLLAAVLIELDEPEEVIKLLAPLEQATPDDAQVLSLLGTAYMKLNDVARGREYLDRASRSAPDAPAIRTQLAVSHLASGDTALAASELEAVIERSPEFSRADFLLVLTRLREGNTDAALAAATRLLEKHPERAEAHNLLGAVHETRKEPERARSAYEKSLELSPDSSAAALNLARLDLMASDTESAEKRFREVLEKRPSEATALMGLAKLASDAGDSERALSLLEQARRENASAVRPRLVLANYYLRRGQADDALTIMLEAQRHAPDTPAVALLLGRSQLAAGKASDARATLERLAAAAPDAPLAHLNLAMAQQAANDPDAARSSLQRTLELQPDNHFARAALGQIEVRSGRYDDALSIADRLAKDLPDAPAGDVLRGDVHQAQGDLPAAVAAYRAGFERQPSSPLLLKLVLAEQRAGMNDQARARALAWLEQHPEDSSVRSILAAASHQGGKEDDALAQYERVLETAPRNVIALNNLAWLYDKRGDDRALDLAKRAHELRPDRPEVQDTYGWLLVKSGRVEQGLSLIEKALEGAPENKDIAFHRAAALHQAGESNRARELLEKLLAETTQFAERDAAQALLEKLRKD